VLFIHSVSACIREGMEQCERQLVQGQGRSGSSSVSDTTLPCIRDINGEVIGRAGMCNDKSHSGHCSRCATKSPTKVAHARSRCEGEWSMSHIKQYIDVIVNKSWGRETTCKDWSMCKQKRTFGKCPGWEGNEYCSTMLCIKKQHGNGKCSGETPRGVSICRTCWDSYREKIPYSGKIKVNGTDRWCVLYTYVAHCAAGRSTCAYYWCRSGNTCKSKFGDCHRVVPQYSLYVFETSWYYNGLRACGKNVTYPEYPSEIKMWEDEGRLDEKINISDKDNSITAVEYNDNVITFKDGQQKDWTLQPLVCGDVQQLINAIRKVTPRDLQVTDNSSHRRRLITRLSENEQPELL